MQETALDILLRILHHLLKSKKKQRTLEYMHDRYPYERKRAISEDLYKQAYSESTEEERDLQTIQELEEDEKGD